MKCKLLNVALVVSASFALTACGNEDLYDPSKSEAAWKEEYGAKFIAQYGNFGTDQSWDASSLAPQYSAATRGPIDDWWDKFFYKEEEDWYYVEKQTLDWLSTKLPGGKNNSGLGKPIAMKIPNNKFTVVPIFQGTAGLTWDLHLVVGMGEYKKDIKFWSKSQGIQKTNEEGNWQDISEIDNNTNYATEVRSKQYTFDFSSYAGNIMYFYLEITGGNYTYGNKGDKLSSLENKMLYLNDCTVGNLDGNEVRIIGCEDATKSTDNDMNDVVFLVYGDPEVPGEIEISNKEIVEEKTKRYMIEDLGSTDDFDFNDIVVDVTDITTKKLTIENGEITNTESIKTEQYAIIRHLGGSIPFQLTIGNTAFEKMEGQIGVNPDSKHTITGWNPDENNISVIVEGRNNGEVYTVTFPAEGEVPMIIATDPEVEWMKERVAITDTWFNALKN